jgi:hypothetical protein
MNGKRFVFPLSCRVPSSVPSTLLTFFLAFLAFGGNMPGQRSVYKARATCQARIETTKSRSTQQAQQTTTTSTAQMDEMK